MAPPEALGPPAFSAPLVLLFDDPRLATRRSYTSSPAEWYNPPVLPLHPPLALSLAGFPTPAGVRAAIEAAPALAVRALVLDAAHPDTRPRALDASARRDLASLLRRCDLDFAGLDLWIPPEHFADPARVDRAVDAASAACTLAGDLARHSGGRALVSLTLPSSPLEGAASAIALAAERSGATLADHSWPVADAPPRASMLAGLDPATLLFTGANPAVAASALLASGRLAAARLSDAGAVGRLPLGAPGSRLDALAYSIALATGGFRQHVTLDVRALADAHAGVNSALAAWAPPTGP